MKKEQNAVDRRTVLKALGSAAVVGAGISGTATSAVAHTDTRRRFVRAYADELRLRTAFRQHGQSLRESLVEAGFVPADFQFDALELDLDSDVNGLEPGDSDGLAGVTAVHEQGKTTAFGTATTSSDTHEIALYVQPQRETAYALVEPKDGDDRVLVTADGVSPAGCLWEECGSCCREDYRTWKEYECDRNCENCVLTNSECNDNCFDCDCGDMTTC